MSYKVKKGIEAINSMNREEKDYTKSIKTLKSGTSFKVRIPSAEEVAEVYIHSVYDVFYSTPCNREDVYDHAVNFLYGLANEAKAKGDNKRAEALSKHAYALKAKPRYLFGFIDLADGEPFVVDLSKKQAQAVIAVIRNYANKLNKLAFELSKQGTGQSTTVMLTPIMFLDEDLTPQELDNFKKSEGVAIPDELYEKCLYVKTLKEQLDDVVKYAEKFRLPELADEVKKVFGEKATANNADGTAAEENNADNGDDYDF